MDRPSCFQSASPARQQREMCAHFPLGSPAAERCERADVWRRAYFAPLLPAQAQPRLYTRQPFHAFEQKIGGYKKGHTHASQNGNLDARRQDTSDLPRKEQLPQRIQPKADRDDGGKDRQDARNAREQFAEGKVQPREEVDRLREEDRNLPALASPHQEE